MEDIGRGRGKLRTHLAVCFKTIFPIHLSAWIPRVRMTFERHREIHNSHPLCRCSTCTCARNCASAAGLLYRTEGTCPFLQRKYVRERWWQSGCCVIVNFLLSNTFLSILWFFIIDHEVQPRSCTSLYIRYW